MSIEFNGVDQSLRVGNDEKYSFDIANGWSIMVWTKPLSVSGAGTQTVFHLNDFNKQDNDNSILIDMVDDQARALIVGSIGNGFPAKYFTYDDFFEQDVWTNVFLTWDGFALKMYKDGIIVPASGTLLNDVNLTQTASKDKSIWFGENKFTFSDAYHGRYYSSAIWNSVLPTTTITGVAGNPADPLSGAKHIWLMEASASGTVDDIGSSAQKISLVTATGTFVIDTP